MKVQIVPFSKDNYAYLLQADDGSVGVVDAGDAQAVLSVLRAQGLALDIIFSTHHHADHIAGNAELIVETDAALVGPAAEGARIAGMDIKLAGGDVFDFGGHAMRVIATPGHTMGHVCFYFPDDGILFTGDALFSMGTGRLFEGSAEDLWGYIQLLKALPDDTLIYCGHEYTRANAAFCLSVEPDNIALQTRAAEVDALLAQGLPTLPVALGVELETNVFLRANSAGELAELRALKEAF